ncbi:MAG: glycosyltransferase family 4 protein [Phycisphaeraceae bacterium]|nr:glycosyltransferase family 4 protein [Phycisphaeraceae bacterium]
MKAMFLIPGTGDFYCGSCLRDHTLMRALRNEGCQAVAIPLYLPWMVEQSHDSMGGDGDGGDQAGKAPIFFGGINTFLDATTRWSPHLPGPLRRALDSPALLRWTARFSHMTRANDVGRLSVSMIEHATRTHGHEIQRLTRFIERDGSPEVLCLGNSMLIGIGIEIGRRLNRPIVCSLQGEDAFIDELPQPWREQTWEAIASRVPQAAKLVAPSHWYAAHMAQRLRCSPSLIETVYNGIMPSDESMDGLPGAMTPTMGYLARMHPCKGLDLLIDAWIALAGRQDRSPAKLIIAGAMTRSDRGFVNEQRARLDASGLGHTVEWRPNLNHADKQRMLGQLTALCVPVTVPEAFGLYVIEAWSRGIPVVFPRIGALPELHSIGGGWLYDPQQPAELVDCLDEALADPEQARLRGLRGRQAVDDRFTDRHMARDFARILRGVAATLSPHREEG